MRVDDCTGCEVRRACLVAYDLLPRLENVYPTPEELVLASRGHSLVVDPAGVTPSIDWNKFVIAKSLDGLGGVQWYGLPDGQLLQVELFSGRFDGCWGHNWDLGATVRIDDPSENGWCSTVLSFNDLADAVEWIGLLRPERGYPDLPPFAETAYRVPDGRVASASVSQWPDPEKGSKGLATDRVR